MDMNYEQNTCLLVTVSFDEDLGIRNDFLEEA